MASAHNAPVLVIGLGRFGAAVAAQLRLQNKEVLAIEKDPELAQKWSGVLTHVVSADATDIDTLHQLGADDFGSAVVGVGTSVVTGSGAPTASMVYKLVEVDGYPVAKRSLNKNSAGGSKRAIRTHRATGTAVEEIIYPFRASQPEIGNLTATMLTAELMRDGEIVAGQPTLEESRAYLAHQLVTLPWEGLALSKDEPVISTRYVGFV